MRQAKREATPQVWSFAVLTVRAMSASLIGAFIGALIGAGTALVQPHVGQPWSALVNSSSPWLLGGFIAGALHRRRNPAVLAGLATLLVEVGAYFATADALNILVMHDYSPFWTVCAVAGGPVAGCAGWAWRWGGPRAHGLGAAFLPGSFIAEAFGAYGLRLHYEPGLTMFLLDRRRPVRAAGVARHRARPDRHPGAAARSSSPGPPPSRSRGSLSTARCSTRSSASTPAASTSRPVSRLRDA